MTEQEKLIGKHPKEPDFFSKWLTFHDALQPATHNKKHRKLNEIKKLREDAIKEIGRWIITYHIRESKLKNLERKKAIYGKYEFEQFLQRQELLPTERDENTQKGNCAEIILSEYLQKSVGYSPLVYKLRYNPNVHQSMKGDDVLLFNLSKSKKGIVLGESKFRAIPSKNAVEEILESLGGNEKLPMSITFISGILRDLGNEELADELDEMQASMFEGHIPIVNVGFLMSNLNVHDHVERHDLFGNYRITESTVVELEKVSFPCQEIAEIKDRVFKTESHLDKEVAKYLKRISVVMDKESEKEIKKILLEHCEKSYNNSLVFVSLAVEEPDEVVRRAFEIANEYLIARNNFLQEEPTLD